MERRKRAGRPKKPDGQVWNEAINVRVNRAIRDAIRAYQTAEMLPNESDAIRELLKLALRHKGRLT